MPFRMKIKTIITIIFICGIAAGCSSWQAVNGPYVSNDDNFEVTVPYGWMKYNTDGFLMLSKDGPFLQYMMIQRRPLSKPFRHTRKQITNHMLPQEAAEVVLDEMRSDRTLRQFVVLSNTPEKIDGNLGFQIIFSYIDRDGLKLKTVLRGFVKDQWYYNLRYTAAERYYFEKDKDDYESLAGSFRLTAN